MSERDLLSGESVGAENRSTQMADLKMFSRTNMFGDFSVESGEGDSNPRLSIISIT
jgi:hypothetical protein